MTAEALLSTLRNTVPTIAFHVERSPDHGFLWDGDGPDPEDDGYEACDVDVTATAVFGGAIVTGSASLGGSYFRPTEPTGDVHGYLPQMLQDAAEELLGKLPKWHHASMDAEFAVAILMAEMKDRHEAQRRELATA